MASKVPRIFISYRRSDSRHATRALAISLRQEFGERAVFVDTSSVELGTTWPDEIERYLDEANIVLAVVGLGWLGGRDGGSRLKDPKDWVRKEIARSLAREVLLIPIFIDGAKGLVGRALPDDLLKFPSKQGVFLNDNSWENDVKLLVENLVGRGFVRRRLKPTPVKKRRLPRLLLMDSYEKIYDRSALGMNSHIIRELLRNERVETIDIEPVVANWQAVDEIERKDPDLIVIHYSCLDDTGRPKNLQRFLRLMLTASRRTKVVVYSRTTARPGDKSALASFNRRIERIAPDYKNRVFGLPIYRYGGRAQKFSDPETKRDLQRLVRDVLTNRRGIRSSGSRRPP